MSWRKVWIVARHEFTTTVKRLAFILVTFGMPFITGGIFLISWLASESSMATQMRRPSEATLYFVDLSGEFSGDLPEDKEKKWIRVGSEKEARQMIIDKRNSTAIIIPEDYLKEEEPGRVLVRTSIPPSIFSSTQSFIPWEFRRWMSRQLVGQIPEKKFELALNPVRSEDRKHLTVTESGVREEDFNMYLGRIASGAGFFFIFFLAISSTGSYLIQGLADEKENRVLEMVMSSVTPTELMFGKLFGLGAAGLLQVAIWSSMGIVSVLFFVTSVILNPVAFIVCTVFFILGYLLFGSLMLGLGSLGSNMRESTQYTVVVTMLAISPMFFLTSLFTEPSGTIARVLSYIPLTAPLTMMIRFNLQTGGLPLWELGLVTAILAVSTWLGVKLAARLYRVGLLMYGKRPKLREIFRWLRAAGS